MEVLVSHTWQLKYQLVHLFYLQIVALCGIESLQIRIESGIQMASSDMVVDGPEVVGSCLEQHRSLDDRMEYLANVVYR